MVGELAAVAAAGLAGRVRAIESLAPTSVTGTHVRRPWVVERVPDEVPAVAPARPWWRRLVDRVLGRR